MDELREKCPWDKKQTLSSLRNLTIEEVYELSEAIINKEPNDIKTELGDILLHIVFYAKIASETELFDITDVINTVCEKLIVRHPHIYGTTVALDENQVKQNWEKIKLSQGNRSVLQGVPKGLPALVKAYRIQEKVSAVGFDWDNKNDVLQKVKEEIAELEQEVNTQNQDKIEKEFGDVFFSLINYARFLNIDPEKALEKTNKKFIKRFNFIEDEALKKNTDLLSMPLSEMERLWQEAKKWD